MSEQPDRIGRYVIERVLGRGAMGVIYRAHDPEIDRTVAVKLVRADLLAGADRDDYVARFRREAQAAGRCMHPNIVALYDFALHDGNPFLAMEFVDGGSLAAELAGGRRFSVGVATAIVGQLLDALDCAHAQGIVHRDIKPANILLPAAAAGAALRVKVTDFGISRLATSDLTQTGTVIGTPSYMSPEQVRGEAADARSDLFSAAVVLYELLSGAKPFPGSSFTEVAWRIVHEPPPDIAALVPGLPGRLGEALRRALQKRPADRFASAAEMAAAMCGTPPELRAADAGTVIVAPRGGDAADATRIETGSVDPALAATLERALARHVGPVARYLVQTEGRRAASADALCRSLARHVPAAADSAAFLADALRAAGAEASGLRAPRLEPAEIERASSELARFMGPVARVLSRRAAARAGSGEELWAMLAEHIALPAERAAFLARR